jgi:hypothetical protein
MANDQATWTIQHSYSEIIQPKRHASFFEVVSIGNVTVYVDLYICYGIHNGLCFQLESFSIQVQYIS